MASFIGVLLLLLGGFVMAFGYGTVLQCLGGFPHYEPSCWDSSTSLGAGALEFYVGAFMAGLGTVILVDPIVARSLGKWMGRGPD